MGLLDKMKQEAAKSGASKGKFIYFRPDDKKRIRFLQELDDGLEITFHDNYERGINVPCQELFGKSCPYCEDEDLRTRSQFAFSVYDYDAKEVKILMQAVNQCSAIPALVNMSETYGTIMDRDYVLKKTGKGSTSNFTIIPMDKNKFRNEKAKPLSQKALLKYLSQAFPCEGSDDDLDDDNNDYDDSPKKSSTKSKKNSDDWDDNNASDYSDMSAKELYDLCCDRDIECQTRRPAKYYINLLKENDEAHDDWDDEEDSDDDWEDEE